LDLIAIAFVSGLLMVVLLETLEIVRLKKRIARLETETNKRLSSLERGSEALRSEVQRIRDSLLDRVVSIENTLSEILKHLERATPSKPVWVSKSDSIGSEQRGNDLKRRALELKIVNMYRSGIPVKQIAREVGLSRATIYRILRKYRAT